MLSFLWSVYLSGFISKDLQSDYTQYALRFSDEKAKHV